eukprot:Protomagalhaensia_wolfi_Nauph_80__283@NODE_1159_length_1690_cov_10_382798_g885_i0_p1_GENE_NODE_1159_length_1690_cov_10_382798_g885_i0NODE_1159_length_1690_cov_10_382798_g885_i0_p1_ORF_typecomplete_len363_score53_49_NODE_1159_length_1690_cov_10_382798_g885_i0691157
MRVQWLLSLIPCVWSMGLMSFPRPRNAKMVCAHCATGHGICGNGLESQWYTSDEPSLAVSSLTTSRTILYPGSKLTIGVYVYANPAGAFVVELCTGVDLMQELTHDCFKRLLRDPDANDWSPVLVDEAPYHAFITTTIDCTKSRIPPAPPLLYTFVIPDDTPPGNAVLRFYWQMGASCCAHREICSSTYNDIFHRFSFLDSHTGSKCTIDPLSAGLSLCGPDCPDATDSGCLRHYDFIRNCADVRIKASTEPCTQPNGDCSHTSPDYHEREGAEKVCPDFDTADCQSVHAISGTSEDLALCQSLCHDIPNQPYAILWCHFGGFCDLDECTSQYSYGKCTATQSTEGTTTESPTQTSSCSKGK